MLTRTELAVLGTKMRRAGMAYYKNPTPGNLKVAKDLEREFDRECKVILAPPGLFHAEEGGEES